MPTLQIHSDFGFAKTDRAPRLFVFLAGEHRIRASWHCTIVSRNDPTLIFARNGHRGTYHWKAVMRYFQIVTRFACDEVGLYLQSFQDIASYVQCVGRVWRPQLQEYGRRIYIS